jgi:DNA polymerase V
MINKTLSNHRIICIDMKSFYASCEAVMRGLDPLVAKIVVVGDVNRNGSVVLASSPQMKKLHKIKTGNRLYEVKNIRDPEIIIAQARMASYLQISQTIKEIFLDYVPPNSLHTYSVDESWLTLDGTEKLWGDSWETSRLIVNKIKEVTGCVAAVGIGKNKFQAKFCLDVYGKEKGIAECNYENFPSLFHHLAVKEMWGIGEGISIRLNRMNIYTVGELAKANTESIKKEFGVVGVQLQQYAWGIDESPVNYDIKNPPPTAFGFYNEDETNENIKSVGRGVTLLKDYVKRDEILLVIRELLEEVCEILRNKGLEGKNIQLSVGYSKNINKKGFSRQFTFKNFYSNDPIELIKKYNELFDKYYEEGAAIRTLRVSVGKLEKEIEIPTFDVAKNKRKSLVKALDHINNKHGKGKVRIASSFSNASVAKDRLGKIGGHFKE